MQEINRSAQKMDESESAYIHLLSHLIEGQRVLILGCKENCSLCLESAKIGFDVVGTYANGAGVPFYDGSTIGSNISNKIQFLIAGGTNLSFRDSSFDSAIIAEALHTAIDLKKILEEAVRVIKNGGRIIVLAENWDRISSGENAKSISKEVINAELMQYTRKVTWHDLPSEKWHVCSIFVHKHDKKRKKKNKIDIIMPTFNGRGSIRRAIESVIYQTYQNWNLIVVNDGGEDIKDIIDEFSDSRIKYICSDHKGKSHSLNVGINRSSGDFIGYLDDDDILYPMHLEVLINAAIDQGCDFIYNDWYEVCIDEFGREINRYFEFRNDVSPSMLILKNYINHKCILHRRCLLNKVGLYDEDLDILIDWDMIRRLTFASQPCHIWSVTSERIQYYTGDVIENRISSLRTKDPDKFKKSLEIIIKKTCELHADEMELNESISDAMLSFSYYHQFRIDQILHEHEISQNKEKSELISQLQSLNKEKSELISQLHLARYRAHVLDIEIAEIKRSISWIITNRFNNSVIERALPHESKRRRWYDLGLKAMRILANDGFSTLLQEYRSRNAYYCSIAHKESENPENTFRETVMDDFLIQLHSFHRNWGIALEVKRHYEKNVDIVICIHNALDDVKSCLMSVIKYSPHIYTLILVDDGSDETTKSFLQDFALHHDAFLLRNDVARGYTFAANQGLRNSTGKYVILLNSDTIVSADWLDRMLECAESDERIGIVGPLSNTASWQSVPKIESCGDWASNDLPENISIHMMADLIGKYSCRCYPKIPFLNGFCLLIKRELINQIGYFDEDSFGAGYGEENDYCIRARKAQWDLAVADDVYIYHKQSRSYSDDRRKKLCDRAGKILIDKHGIQEVSEGVSECKGNRAMAGIRARADVLWHRHGLLEEGKKLFKGKSLLIILPIMEPTGGAYVIIQEAYALIEMGVRVSLFNLTEHGVKFQQSFPDLRIPVIYGSINEVPLIAADFDAVIATINNSVYWIASLNSSDITLAYYIQDFEPDFYPKGSREYNLAWESYMKIPRIKNVTKTSWNKNKVMSNMGIDCQIIGPSVDIDLFRPRERLHKSNDIFIGAMIRPSTPRRNPRFTLEILEEIKKLYGDKINIITFGCSNDDFLSLNPCRDIPINHMGVLKREWMPHLFNEIDIFVDFSTYQAMGLTALEAMACGSAVIVPRNGGCQDFVKDGINGFLIDTTDRRSCTDALEKLINDEKLRKKMCSQSIIDVCRFPAELAALNMLKAIFI